MKTSDQLRPRGKRRQTIEGEASRVRQFERKERELRLCRRGLGYVPLSEPIRCGWQRFFVVRSDVARSPEGPTLERVLAILQNVEVSRRKDFAVRNRWRGGKLKPSIHSLCSLTDQQFDHKVPDELKKHFIYLHERKRNRYTKQWEWRRYWTARHPWKFISQIRSNYITHQRVLDSELQAEMSYIDWRLHSGPGKSWPFRYALRGGRKDWDRDRKEDVYPLVEEEDGAYL